ncbi:MAG: energy-coupling factor ABC transporter permease [Patescibacteria group bacterium]
MHIPDGFLNNNVAGPLLGTAGAFAAVAAHKLRSAVTKRVMVQKKRLATAPDVGSMDMSSQTQFSAAGRQLMLRMATVGALIFAAQMMNFPIAGGTSGHLLGGVLAALILGPWAGFIVITVIVAIQAFVFGDGGLVALGANIINMGLIGTVGGWHVFQYIFRLYRRHKKYTWLAMAITAWLSVMLAATAASLEFGLAGTISMSQVLPAMLSIHALIGIGEAIITVAFIAFLQKRNEPLFIFTDNQHET